MVVIIIKIVRIVFRAFDFKCCFLCHTYAYVSTECCHNSFASLSLPGPCNNNNYLSVFYQNVQGLIPFSQLSNPNPMLDQTKIMEIHACIYEQESDIIILNETWLKSTINDNEVIPSNLYKIYRCDSSIQTNTYRPPNLDFP